LIDLNTEGFSVLPSVPTIPLETLDPEGGDCLEWNESKIPLPNTFSNDRYVGSWGDPMDPAFNPIVHRIDCIRCGEPLGRKAKLTTQVLCKDCRQKDNQLAPSTDVKRFCQGCRFNVNPIGHGFRCSHQFGISINWPNNIGTSASSSETSHTDPNEMTLDEYLKSRSDVISGISPLQPRDRIDGIDFTYDEVITMNQDWKDSATITIAKGKSSARYKPKYTPKVDKSENTTKTIKKNKKMSKKEEEKQAALAEQLEIQRKKK